MSSLGLGFGLTSIPVLQNRVTLAVSLYNAALSAAQAAGASLWLFPPASLADPATNGPFVNSDQTGGNPALGSGVIGWLKDFSGSNNATQSTSANRAVYLAAPGAAAAAAGYGAASFDGGNDGLRIDGATALDAPGVWICSASNLSTAANATMVGRAAAASHSSPFWRWVIGGSVTGNIVTGVNGNFAISAGVSGSGAKVITYHPSTALLRVNGTATGTTPAAQSATYPDARPILIGQNASGGEVATGPIGMICVAPSAPTSDQRAAIERLGAYIVGATYAG
jgi:hypothetical protein